MKKTLLIFAIALLIMTAWGCEKVYPAIEHTIYAAAIGAHCTSFKEVLLVLACREPNRIKLLLYPKHNTLCKSVIV